MAACAAMTDWEGYLRGLLLGFLTRRLLALEVGAQLFFHFLGRRVVHVSLLPERQPTAGAVGEHGEVLGD